MGRQRFPEPEIRSSGTERRPRDGFIGIGSAHEVLTGRVPRTGSVRTASGPEGSSAKDSLPGAAVPPGPSRRRRFLRGSPFRRRSARPGVAIGPATRAANKIAPMAALYRTYRPLDFGHVIGQEAVVRTLRNAIEHDQVRQAYLFAGPRGTGKTSMARILAKALNAEGGPNADFDPSRPHRPRDRRRHLARRDRDGRRLAAGDRRRPRDPRARRAAAGRGRLQGLHHRRGPPAHDAGLERAAEADRGAAAPPRLRLLHHRSRERAADRALALPDVRVPAAAPARARRRAAPRLRGGGDRRARRCAGADRPRRARLVPRRGLDARPARGRHRQHDLRAGRAPARRRGRGGLPLPALRHDRRPRHRRRARPDRGARRAGTGPRPARHRR